MDSSPASPATESPADAMREAQTHHRAGRLGQAEAEYERVLAAEPMQARALALLGVLMYQTGRHERAAAALSQAVTLDPTDANSYCNLAEVNRLLGRLPAAESAARSSLAIKIDSPVALNTLGIILHLQDKLHEAEAVFGRAIVLQPVFPEGYNNLGNTLREMGRWNDAIAAFTKAINVRPHYAEAWSNLGIALKRAKRLDEAMSAYRKAIELKKDFPDAWNNLGLALLEAERYEEAVAAHQTAIDMSPNFADAFTNLGVALQELGRREESRAAYERAMTLRPDDAIAHYNSALALLLEGDFERGWREYEWRWQCREFPSPRFNFAQPMWRGEDLHGKTLLLHEEQGLGDTIQFIRYAAMARGRGAQVVVQCQPTLVDLLISAPGVSVVVKRGDALPPFDYHCPMLSAPGVFRTERHTIPANVPYLRADEKRVSKLRRYFDAPPGMLRAGLVWAGSSAHKRDRHRSCKLETLRPLLTVPGVQFYSLQKGPAAEQLANPLRAPWPIDLGPLLNDFADTAAAIMQLDVVIAVDTAVAHLAGALGKMVWTLLPFSPDFRWGLEGSITPWYPTMRLFRQSQRGDWETPVEAIHQRLLALKRAG